MMREILRYGYIGIIGIITCFIFLVNPSIILADEEILKISLKDAIAMAIKASEDIQIQDNEVARSNSQLRKAKSELFPHIVGSAGWTRNYEYPDIPQAAFTEEYNLDVGVTLEQKLFTFGKIGSAISAARKSIEVSKYNRQSTQQEVIYNTKVAYYSACLAERVLKIWQESYQNVEQNKEILKSRWQSGRVSRRDNIKILADIASRMAAVNNAQADYCSAMETLKVLIGVEPKTKIVLIEGFSDEYQVLQRQSMVSALYNNQPAIKALAEIIKVKEDLVKSKKSAYYPEISAFTTWNHKGGSNDYYVGNNSLEDYGIVGLKVNIPIWTGGRTSAELQQARIDKRNAELEYQKGRKNYLLKLDKALTEYHEYIKTLKANEEAVRLAQESFKLSQDLFRSGQISATDLNDAELALVNEKLSKEATLFNINIALARIEWLTLTACKDE